MAFHSIMLLSFVALHICCFVILASVDMNRKAHTKTMSDVLYKQHQKYTEGSAGK